MRIAGFVKNSFVDYPGQIASVVFTNGCNFDCWYCHNRKLISGSEECISEEEIFKFLEKRKGQIDGVVITGGEPTIQNGLEEFISKIKKLGFLVKLDTNGSNPERLKEIIAKKLVDFVAMDIKSPSNKLEDTARAEKFSANILSSIDIILHSGIKHEFRTTLVPSLGLEDVSKMAKLVEGAKAYVLQKYNPTDEAMIRPYNRSFFEKSLQIAKETIPNSFLRGF